MIKTSHLGMSAPKSFTLCALSSVDLCANYHLLQEEMKVDNALISGYSNMLLYCHVHLSENKSRFSIPAHDLSSLRFLTSLMVSGISFISRALNQIRENSWLLASMGLFFRQVTTVTVRVCSWVRLMISFSSTIMCSTF